MRHTALAMDGRFARGLAMSAAVGVDDTHGLSPAQRMSALFYLGVAGWLAVAAMGYAIAG